MKQLSYFAICLNEQWNFISNFKRDSLFLPLQMIRLSLLEHEGYLPPQRKLELNDIQFNELLDDVKYYISSDERGYYIKFVKEAYDKSFKNYEARAKGAKAANKIKDENLHKNNAERDAERCAEHVAPPLSLSLSLSSPLSFNSSSLNKIKSQKNNDDKKPTIKENLTVESKAVAEYKKPKDDILEEQFEALKQAYPKREVSHNKKTCMVALKRVLQAKNDFLAILAGARSYDAYCRASNKERRFIKMLPTWLNQEDWKLTYENVTVMRDTPKTNSGIGGVMERLRQEEIKAEFNETMGNLKDVTDYRQQENRYIDFSQEDYRRE